MRPADLVVLTSMPGSGLVKLTIGMNAIANVFCISVERQGHCRLDMFIGLALYEIKSTLYWKENETCSNELEYWRKLSRKACCNSANSLR